MRVVLRASISILSAVVITLVFLSTLNAKLSNFESTAKSKEAAVNEYIQISTSFIDLMTVYGDNYLEKNSKANQPLCDMIEYDKYTGRYNMDSVGRSQYASSVGNITGIGNIPRSGIMGDQINLSLDYSKYFAAFYKRVPETAWIYYISEDNFVYLYPWVSSYHFKYYYDMKKQNYYTVASPEEDPERKAVWTPVYVDEAGKGLVVTLSSPIYYDNAFTGVLAFDLSTERLGEMISSEYQSYLIDHIDSVIAVGQNINFNKKQMKFSDLSGLSQTDINTLKEDNGTKVQFAQGRYVYTDIIPDTPWRLYFTVSMWSFVLPSALFTLPLIALAMVLFWLLSQVDKRRKAELKLTDSLAEIRSYQTLLENAATHDFLTDTCNRRGLSERFQNLLTSSEDKITASFIMGDIDKFKNINDTYGHATGDKVLVQLTNILKKNIGSEDVVCRWGGEEFVILLLDRVYSDALLIAEKIRKEIESSVIKSRNSDIVHATMTLGVSPYFQDDTLQSAVSKADKALYAGKEKGRNCVVGWEEIL